MSNTTVSFLNSSSAEGELNADHFVIAKVVRSLGIIGNIIALFFLKHTSKHHKYRPFYRTVGALTMTDLFTSAFVIPLFIFQAYTVTPKICQYLTFCASFGILSSALIICLMPYDRYMAITRPLFYHINCSSRRTTIALVSIWLMSACISTLPIVGFGSAKKFSSGPWCFIDFLSTAKIDRVYAYIYSALCSGILIYTFITNFAVIVFLCRNLHGGHIERCSGRKHDVCCILLLLVFVMAFGVCLTPLTVTMLKNVSFGGKEKGTSELLVALLAMGNGIIDPWIYLLLRKENILRCFRFCRSGMKRFHRENTNEINIVAPGIPGRNTVDHNLSSTTKAETHM